MQALRFDTAIENILKRETRFEAGAYFLLKDALDFTLKRTREEHGEERQVEGKWAPRRFIQRVFDSPAA